MQIRIRRFFCIIVLLIIVLLPARSSAQWEVGASFATENAMSGIISEITAAINEALDRLDQSVSSGTFLARMQLQILLAEVEYLANSVIGTTFGELDEQQQIFFRNTGTTIKQIADMGNDLADTADTVIQRVEFAIGSIPLLSSKEPRLRSHTPRVIEAQRETPNSIVRVSFNGSWLANGEPLLSFGDTKCDIIDQKEPSAVFECPGSLFATGGRTSSLNGKLLLVDEKGIFRQNYKEYPISIAILPSKFADVDITVKHEMAKIEKRTRDMDFDTGAQHCVNNSQTLLNITPGSGWKIDVGSSIAITEKSSNRGSHEVRNLTEAGFQFFAIGRNSGNCVRTFGQTVSRDSRGWHNGQITWTEFRAVPVQSEKQVFSGSLNWGDSRVASLGENVISFLVRVKRFDGRTREYNSPAVDEFIVISRDDRNRSLRVEPRPIELAFR